MSTNVYVIMSSAKAHCYSNWATWSLVLARAERMGVKGLEAFRPALSGFKTRKSAKAVEKYVNDIAEAARREAGWPCCSSGEHEAVAP